MKNSFTLLIALLIVGFLLAYMFAFQVRYDEVVVLTTFDRAQEPARGDGGEILRDEQGRMLEPGSVIEQPGLYFKWPWPIQKATAYSQRVQVLEDVLEQLKTADGFTVAVQTYMTWRIEDPLAFFVNLKDMSNARGALNSVLRNSALIGDYRFDELVNIDPSQLKIKEIEQRMAEEIGTKLAQQGYGIRVEQVGIRRVVLPQDVTQKVFERMKATQQRIAAETRNSGEAIAGTIRSEAETAKQRIMAHAEGWAQSLRAQGEREAAEYYKVLSQDQELAMFLARIDSMEKWISNRATLILPAEQLGFDKVIGGSGGEAQPPLRPAATPDDGSEVKFETAEPQGNGDEVRIPLRPEEDHTPEASAAKAP